MSSKLQNSIWPNEGGTLGQIKVQIPDGVNTFWPEGDALVGNFVYKNGKLVGFVDTKALTVNESKSTIINYDYFDIELPFTEGEITITRGPRSKYFNVRYNPINDDNVVITLKYKNCKTVEDITAVDSNFLTNDIIDGVWSEGLGDLTNGGGMFIYCSNLESFSSDLSNLTNGSNMFLDCSSLTLFSSDLSNLTNGWYMFYNCSNLTSFSSDSSGSPVNLSSLTNGEYMFHNCSNLTSFSSDLSSLLSGYRMFANCRTLNSFSSNLSNLTDGNGMFNYCTNLESFYSNLSSLTDGRHMFNDCKLDTPSVQNIADTINTHNGSIHIRIGNFTPNIQEDEAFNQIVSKGWIVYVNGSPNTYIPGYYGYAASASLASSVMTLDELGETEMFNPKPYWAKPINSDEQHAQYIDEQGNFYNILGAQFIYGDNLENYGMFTCEEDAAAQMRLTKIEK